MKKAISFALILPIIIAIGAQLGTWLTPLLLIASICAVIVLVALNKIKGNRIYLYLLGLALSLLWQTTMMGVDVVGSDIHTELYYARYNVEHAWDITYPDSSNTSFVIGLFAPMLATIFKCDVVWIFKIVLPLFLACVPLILFKMYKGIFGEKRAFFASMFFMIIPVYSMEIAQIAKSMVAELFLAIMFLALVNDWKQWVKCVVIMLSLCVAVLAHYTVGIIGICFLLGLFIFRLITQWWKWKLVSNRKTHLITLLIPLLICISVFWMYHGYAANGSAVRSVKEVIANYLPSISTEVIQVKQSHSDVPIKEVIEQKPELSRSMTASIPERMNDAPTLVKIGTGLDFLSVPIEGQVFRVIQYLTQLMIIIGVLWLIFAYKKHNYPAEYVGLVGCSCVLLMMCIAIPSVSIIINMTRFYHYSLLTLSPVFVVGGEYIVDKIKIGGKYTSK
jgi:uncharacterized membrane protein